MVDGMEPLQNNWLQLLLSANGERRDYGSA